jgi:hypothetical protein
MTFFLLRARFTSSGDKFLPVGVLATDGVNIIYQEVPNGIKTITFVIKTVEKLKLKYKNKKYTYKDDPRLFLELLIQHFASSLSSDDKFHPLFLGSMEGNTEEVASNITTQLATFEKNYISLEELKQLKLNNCFAL